MQSKNGSGRLNFLSIFAALILWGCGDLNDSPKYGQQSGLPANCRAYVQSAIDAYRAKQYSAEATMNALERNCGHDGHLWGHKP